VFVSTTLFNDRKIISYNVKTLNFKFTRTVNGLDALYLFCIKAYIIRTIIVEELVKEVKKPEQMLN